MPLSSQASVFSFFSHLFESARAATVVVDENSNSQKMALPQPVLNSNPTPSDKSGQLAMVGDALLTENGPEGSNTESTYRPTGDQISIYTVRDGDTISGIAKLFNVSPNTILWANNLRSGASLKKGDVLVILPISGVRYTVRKGDTVKSIAKVFNADADEITSYNDLQGKLVVGTEVIIPDGEAGDSQTPTRTPSKSSNSVKSSGSVVSSSGYFKRPIDGGVKTQGIHGHNGVDLGSPVGTSIHAAAAGQVIIAKSGGWNGGYGTYVVISHPNGMQTLYAHMENTAVSVGDHVEKGDTIGHIGLTGQTTGPHLHFEVRGGKNPF